MTVEERNVKFGYDEFEIFNPFKLTLYSSFFSSKFYYFSTLDCHSIYLYYCLHQLNQYIPLYKQCMVEVIHDGLPDAIECVSVTSQNIYISNILLLALNYENAFLTLLTGFGWI